MCDQYLSATQMADAIGVHRSTLNRAILAKVVKPAARARGRYLFTADQVPAVAAQLGRAKQPRP